MDDRKNKSLRDELERERLAVRLSAQPSAVKQPSGTPEGSIQMPGSGHLLSDVTEDPPSGHPERTE